MKTYVYLALALLTLWLPARGQYVLIPMDFSQTDHLKAYGIAYWSLEKGVNVEWLLNYRGGRFWCASFRDWNRSAAFGGWRLKPLMRPR